MIEAYGKIENGNVIIYDKQLYEDEFKRLEGKLVEITILPADSRTNQQLRYYYGVVIPVIQKEFKRLGNDWAKDEVDYFLRSMFHYKIIEYNGNSYKCPARLNKNISKTEMSEFIDKIKQWALIELNTDIPEPIQINIK